MRGARSTYFGALPAIVVVESSILITLRVFRAGNELYETQVLSSTGCSAVRPGHDCDQRPSCWNLDRINCGSCGKSLARKASGCNAVTPLDSRCSRRKCRKLNVTMKGACP